MRLTHLKVEGLFGIFNHNVSLKREERITILHGPNGYGKTIILKMIDGLLSGTYSILRSVPFSSFRIGFDDGSEIAVRQQVEEKSPVKAKRGRSTGPAVRLEGTWYTSAGERPFKLESTTDQIPRAILTSLNQLLPARIALIEDGFIDVHTSDRISVEDLLTTYRHLIPASMVQQLSQVTYPREHPLTEIREHISARFIETRRLDVERRPGEREPVHRFSEPGAPQYRLAVEEYSGDLARLMNSVFKRYAATGSELDRTFPGRLLTQYYAKGSLGQLPPEELRAKLEQNERERKRLVDLGFLDQEDLGFLDQEGGGLSEIPQELFSQRADVLSVYASDTETKLRVFAPMAARVEMFREIINRRFTYKNLSIRRDQGFVFTSSAERGLSPGYLSSGEQHELVLLYELLFKGLEHATKPALLLIDEPEISLHVSWQHSFLDDLRRIVRLSDVHIIIATHSPSIVGNHWDLTVELQGPQGPA